MAFPPLKNSDHVVSASISFPSNSQHDVPLYRIAYDYSHSYADWDGLCYHLKDVRWKEIFKSLVLLLLVSFVSGFRLGLMSISLIENIR